MALRANEKCYIGMPSCNYVFESAKLCFVAAPADDKHTLKLDLIRRIVEEKQYECYIALKRLDPGTFAFCTKICSKIIQSQFCIVLLDHSSKDSFDFPNPNVHFEYGMMLSQNKHIIPLQHSSYNLPFNIAPLDTIKYTEGNFEQKVREVVEIAVNKFTPTTIISPATQGQDLLTFLSIKGFSFCNITEGFYQYLYNYGKHLGFNLAENNLQYKYVGIFETYDPKVIVLNTKLLIDNIIQAYKRFISNTAPDLHSKYLYMIKDISIDLFIPPFIEKVDIYDRIGKIISKEYAYPISVFQKTDIIQLIEKEYENIANFQPKNLGIKE